jgi:hypothetical protein
MKHFFLFTVVLMMPVCLTGCGVLQHLIGFPEPAPPLGSGLMEPFSLDWWYASFPSDEFPTQRIPPPSWAFWDYYLYQASAQPAIGATEADLAGIWVEAVSGAFAVHVDAGGWIYQVDLSDMVGGEPLPPEIPRIVFNAGRLMVNPDGGITGELAVSLPGFSGSGTLSGVLGHSLDIITDVVMDESVVVQDQTSNGRVDDMWVWLRWDPQTGTFPFVENARSFIENAIETDGQQLSLDR